jgi:polysaccharide chain length determinant protein (PEP-CTERM system associated)
VPDDLSAGSSLDFVRGVWRRRRLLALVVLVVGLAATVGVILAIPSIYRSTATVLVERQVPEAFVRPSVTGELDTRLQTLSQQILSRPRLQTLITQFELYPDLRTRQSPESVVDRMRRDIQLGLKGVEQTGGRSTTIAFTLSYVGRNPETVAAVTNTLASFYVEENLRDRGRQASGTAEFLKHQLEAMKVRLEEHEARVSAFKLRHMGELPEQVPANLATLTRLNEQLRVNGTEQTRLAERRAALTRPAPAPERRGTSVEPDAVTSRLVKLNQELAELRIRFTDKHPDVAKVKAEIAALRRQHVESAAGHSADAPTDPRPPDRQVIDALVQLDAQLKSLKDEEAALRQEMSAYQRRVESAPKREQEFRQLARDYDTTKELYHALVKRYEEAELAESMEQRQRAEHFRIVEPAIAATRPAAPNRRRLLLLGVAFPLGAAALAVAVAERLDTSFHTVDDVRAFTRVPVVGRIPRVHTRADVRRRRGRLALGALATVLLVALILSVSSHVIREHGQLVSFLIP